MSDSRHMLSCFSVPRCLVVERFHPCDSDGFSATDSFDITDGPITRAGRQRP